MKSLFFQIWLLAALVMPISMDEALSKGEEMRVTSTGIQDGHWEKKYGKYGRDFIDGIPALSIPFAIHNPPQGTKSFAAVLIDYDAEKVAGHPWVHWLVANLGYDNVGAGESRSANAFIQGQNSWGQNYYGGMTPPDAPHQYELHIYALDEDLPLAAGFTYPELKKAMEGHILGSYTLSLIHI